MSKTRSIKYDNELRPSKGFCPYCNEKLSSNHAWIVDKRKAKYLKERRVAKGLSDVTYQCKNCNKKFKVRA